MQRDDFASEEEYHFALWCDEALRAGFIQSWQYEPFSYPLSPAATYDKKVWRGRGAARRQVTQQCHLMHPHEYTPDFIVTPSDLLDSLPHRLIGTREYVIDIKGTFQQFDGARSFSINQKWVYQAHGVYVNKCIPTKFFKRTWVPANAAFGGRGKRLKRYAECALLEEIHHEHT